MTADIWNGRNPSVGCLGSCMRAGPSQTWFIQRRTHSGTAMKTCDQFMTLEGAACWSLRDQRTFARNVAQQKGGALCWLPFQDTWWTLRGGRHHGDLNKPGGQRVYHPSILLGWHYALSPQILSFHPESRPLPGTRPQVVLLKCSQLCEASICPMITDMNWWWLLILQRQDFVSSAGYYGWWIMVPVAMPGLEEMT